MMPGTSSRCSRASTLATRRRRCTMSGLRWSCRAATSSRPLGCWPRGSRSRRNRPGGTPGCGAWRERECFIASCNNQALQFLACFQLRLLSSTCPGCSLLEQMQTDIQSGKFAYQPPWAAHQEQGSGGSRAGHTGHSAASSLGAAFLTPGVLDERRNRSVTLTLVRVHTDSHRGAISGRPPCSCIEIQSYHSCCCRRCRCCQ